MSLFDQIDPSWRKILKQEWQKPYMQKLFSFLAQEETQGHQIFPPAGVVFNALHLTPFEDVRVVIMGQDPYSGPGQAHGLSFSVPEGIPVPPSLQNIFTEISSDLGVLRPKQGCLIDWARQGVLLLNAVLTVRKGEPRAHYGRGWESWTDKIIQALAERKEGVVFLLWGKAAQEKCKYLNQKQHLILTAAHPSPLSAYNGFFGCRHFSRTNAFLTSLGQKPIQWSVEKS